MNRKMSPADWDKHNIVASNNTISLKPPPHPSTHYISCFITHFNFTIFYSFLFLQPAQLLKKEAAVKKNTLSIKIFFNWLKDMRRKWLNK